MAQETSVIDFKRAYYASLATAIPARPYTSATDFVAAGYTRILEPDGDVGALWTWSASPIYKRPAGTKKRTGVGYSEIGLDSITLQSINSDDTALLLAFPDMTHDGASITGGGATLYYRVIMVTDNNVYVAKKISPSGNVALNAVNSAGLGTPYEFMAFEDDDNDPAGTANWFIEPLLS